MQPDRFLLLALTTLLSQPLLAQGEMYVKRGSIEREGHAWVERVECGAPVREGARLVVRADQGSLTVRPGADHQLRCQVLLRAYTAHQEDARRILGRFAISLLRGDQGGAYLRGTLRDLPAPPAPAAPPASHSTRSPRPPRAPGALRVEFQIEVPVRFNLDLETQGGGLEVERLDGELRAVTAGGSIRVGDVRGPVRAETAGGGIELGNIGQAVEARTAGGGIRVGNVQSHVILETSGGEIAAGVIAGNVRAETAGGDIVLRGASGSVIAQTAGGQIWIGETQGGVRAETAGGSIHLDAARGPIRVETAGGSINLYRVHNAVRATTSAGSILAQFDTNRQTFGASALETSVGDLRVYLPVDLPVTIEAIIEQAGGHQILADFPLEVRGRKGWGSGEKIFYQGTVRGSGQLNGGGEVLRLRTVAGNIEIRKLDVQSLEQVQKQQESLWKRLVERWQRQVDRHREKERLKQEREREHQQEER